MGGAARVHQCVLEAKSKVTEGVILGIGTTKQLYRWFFPLPLKTSLNF